MHLLDVFLQTLNVTLPVFAMVFIGIGLKRSGWIDTRFISTASDLVFKGTLPTLIFFSILQADFDATFNAWLLIFFALGIFSAFVLSWLWACWRVPHADRGIYVQGAFRGNCGIVGMALAANMYGEYGLSAGSLLLGVVVLVHNALSVVILTAYQPGAHTDWRNVIRQIGKNPLILTALVAIPLSWANFSLPEWMMTSGDYFASLTLPLALICTGGSLSVDALRGERSATLGSSLIKMITFPAVGTAAAWLAGFSGPELGLLFLFFASPSAAASFVMAKAMDGNAKLAANIIALTTLMASVTVTSGVFVLRVGGLI